MWQEAADPLQIGKQSGLMQWQNRGNIVGLPSALWQQRFGWNGDKIAQRTLAGAYLE
jgi:hypothetical protein